MIAPLRCYFEFVGQPLKHFRQTYNREWTKTWGSSSLLRPCQCEYFANRAAIVVPPSSHDLARHHSTPMNGERRCKPRASELPDDIEDARVVGGLPDEPTQV